MVLRFQFNQGFMLRLILICGLVTQCRMADLNNPSDALSDEFAKRSILSEFVRYLLLEKALPDGLVLLLRKSTVPYEAGYRIYRVDPEFGLTGEYDSSNLLPANLAAFPGCDPVRIAVPPGSRDIVTFVGITNQTVAVHRYGTDRTIGFIQDEVAIGAPQIPAFNADGTTMYFFNTSVNPNTVNRSYRNKVSGKITLNNVGSYPFGVGCSPVSLKTSDADGLIFSTTTVGAQTGINVFKMTGPDSNFYVGGAAFNSGSTPTQHNNLCLIESNKLLYMTSVNTTHPIYGYRYDSNGNMQILPNSPFSPDSAYSLAATTDNISRSLTVDPNGRFAAFLYSSGGTHYIRILSIDGITGNLTPTDQKLSVGNAPKHMEWDGSGKFIYLISDTGGSTNKFQMEYFQFSHDGTLTRGINSPITVSNMSSDYAPKDLKPIQKFYH